MEPDLALLHEVGRLGQGERRVDRLFDQDHRHPLVAHFAHQGKEFLDDHRGQPEGQLVDHEQPGPGQEGHGQAEHLLLASRQVAGPVA